MQLVARSVLWLHVTLYRLTNGHIGGRFIAGSPILLLTTTGRRPASAGPDRWPTSATGSASCCAPPTAAPHTILVGTTTCARPAAPRSRSARAPCRQRQDRRSHRAQPAVPPLCADVQGLRRLRAQD